MEGQRALAMHQTFVNLCSKDDKVLLVCNDIMASNKLQNFHFWGNYPFKPFPSMPFVEISDVWLIYVTDVVSTILRDLHKELSALRVSLENVTVMSTASNMSQVMWRVMQLMHHTLNNCIFIWKQHHVISVFSSVCSCSRQCHSLIILKALRCCIALSCRPAQTGQLKGFLSLAFTHMWDLWREASSMSSKSDPTAAACMAGRATPDTYEYQR